MDIALTLSLIETFTGKYKRRSEYEDIIQEAALLVWRTAHAFDPSRGAWRAFVRMKVRRAIQTHYQLNRKQHFHEFESLDDAGDEKLPPISNLIDPRQAPDIEALDRVELAQALNVLSSKNKRLAVFMRTKGKTLQQIGNRLGMSREGARLVLKKAAQELSINRMID